MQKLEFARNAMWNTERLHKARLGVGLFVIKEWTGAGVWRGLVATICGPKVAANGLALLFLDR